LVFVEDLGSPSLGEDDCHHLGEVLRLKPGEAVAATDGAGTWVMCTFTGPKDSIRGRGAGRGAKHCRFGLEVAGPIHHADRPSPALEVGFSWAKSDRTEWAVAKLAELGLDLVTPLVADRTVVRPDRDRTARRMERLSKILRESAMQSRRPFLSEIGTTQSVDEVIKRARDAQVALAEPGGDPISLETPIVLVGPEGGWSPRELALVDKHVSLGDGVLRIETAALAAASMLTALRSDAVA
jgi:16S rRNA (uracil1498-N3)-methyltransferase